MSEIHGGGIPIVLGVLAEGEPLEKTLGELRAWLDADGADRVAMQLRVAIVAALAGRRELAAEALLRASGARGTAEECELELTRAFVVLEAGDAARAQGALARARAARPSAIQTAWASVLELDVVAIEHGAVAALSAVSAASAALEALGTVGAGAWARLAIARLALEAGRPELAAPHLEAVAGSGARLTGLVACEREVLRARAWLDVRPSDPVAARTALSRAVWMLLRIGAPRRLGLAYLAMARVEAAARGLGEDGATNEQDAGEEGSRAAASWLARAQPLIARAGSPRDEELLRRAFRLHGRRQLDRLVDADLGTAIDALRARHARLRDVLAAAHDARGAGTIEVPDEAGALDRLREQEELVIAALEGVIVDRERVGQLVRVTHELARADGPAALLDATARLAIELCAAEGAEVLEPSDPAKATRGRSATTCALDVVARHGAPLPIARPRLEREVREAIEEGDARLVGQESYQPRGGEAGGGRIAIIPLALASGAGALVVGRVSRGGHIGERDLERLTIHASLAAASLDRARAGEELARAAARDAATLEAIRDGIVTFDEEGAIQSMNRAAARLLRVTREDAIGKTLAAFPSLAPLTHTLAEARSVDGDVVALAHGDLLVRARPYEGGVVATVQELQSAQRIAQRIVGNTARFTFADLVGRDAGFQAALEAAQRAARTDVAILVTGESGTGKEMLAQAIHNASPRASAPFVGINVAAIPRELLESELFGYERGAFTGARAGGMVGKLELAAEGTVLLDEIGDMPWEMQAKLLRVLQERSVVRLGGSREVPIRARIVATTHQDLDVAVREGRFRLDLFYRLRGVHLRLPPLRERRDDVPVLVERYLARVAEREGRRPLRVAPSLMEQLVAYDWPGNVRELANLVEAEASLAAPDTEELVHRPAALSRALAKRTASSAPPAAPSIVPRDGEAPVSMEAIEKRAFAHALRHFDGNVAAAARALGVSRGTFYNKIKAYGIGEGSS